MTTPVLPVLPFSRPGILDPALDYRTLQRDQPVARVRTPAGDVGWLVTRYDDVKSLLADRRLGRGHPDPERAARYSRSLLEGGPLGDGDPAAEDAQYARTRVLLAPAFSPRRMKAAHSGVRDLVEDLFGQMTAQTPPVDFHRVVTFTLPVMVVCGLLGVPAGDREQFRAWFAAATALYDASRAAEGYTALVEYTGRLIEVKRAQPGEDVISDLLAAVDEGEAGAYLPQLVAGLLYAGHETTVERLDYGTLHLLAHPDQLDALRRDPALLPGAVEEVLRVAAPGRPPRIAYARTDLEVRGVQVRAGDLVMLAIQAANHDPAVFPDPARFDVTRKPNPHLSFGYGGHFCLGASMARTEMELVFSAIVKRQPSLCLAVPLEEMLQHENTATGGLNALPVTW